MSFDSIDFATLSRLLDEAIDLSPDALEEWLMALPSQHRHLLPRLRDMLVARMDPAHSRFLSDGPKLKIPTSDNTAAHAGDLVGPYRLIRGIGEGGMGTVWLAERADGTLKRHIALKLPRLAWGARLAERMARERDIGALLEHPNIARLYDAGVDEAGRPYLALEFVDGIAIDRWCKQHALDVPAKLRLVVQVIRAVAYAHGRLVVHRDLKPSNVLVSNDGQVHLLDFGIAKLIDDDDPVNGLTQEQHRLLTPHYASPEQIRGDTVTVESDVYSLGVLLFELVTDQLPLQTESDRLRAAARSMLEDEPPLASSRATEKGIAKALHGEVDAILGKALKPEPRQRYGTAEALADDIERHLEGERVLARPDSALYRMRKLVARHRKGFLAASLVTVSIIGGVSASIVSTRRAAEAAENALLASRRADVSAERSRVVNEFVVDIFKINGHNALGDDDRSRQPIAVLLERGARLIETRFAGQPELQAQMYGIVANIFLNSGAYANAALYAGRQVDVLRDSGADRQERVKATILLAAALSADYKLSEAEQTARLAFDLSEPRSAQWVEAAEWLVRILNKEQKRVEAAKFLALVSADPQLRTKAAHAVQDYLFNRVTFTDAEATLNHYRVALPDKRSGLFLGSLYLLWGDIAKADPLITQSAEAMMLAFERSDPKLYALEMQQFVAMYAGRHEQSERLSQETLDPQRWGDTRRLLMVGLPDVKALNLTMQRRFEEAEAALAAGPMERYGSAEGVARSRAKLQLERGNPASALEMLPAESSDLPDRSLLFDDRMLRGEILCATGQFARGLALIEASIRHYEPLVSEHHPELARVRAVAGLCALDYGQRDKAVTFAKRSRAAFVEQPGVSAYFKRPGIRLDELIASS